MSILNSKFNLGLNLKRLDSEIKSIEKEINEKFMKIAFHFAPSVLNQLKDREEYVRLNEETATLLVRSTEFEPLHTKHYYNLGLLMNNIGTLKSEAALEAIKHFQKKMQR